MHMYAWTKSQATLYQGILLGVAGVVALLVFAAIRPLSKKFNDRQLLVIGFVFCVAGYFVFISWGHKTPPRPALRMKNSTHSDPLFHGSIDDSRVYEDDWLLFSSPSRSLKDMNLYSDWQRKKQIQSANADPEYVSYMMSNSHNTSHGNEEHFGVINSKNDYNLSKHSTYLLSNKQSDLTHTPLPRENKSKSTKYPPSTTKHNKRPSTKHTPKFNASTTPRPHFPRPNATGEGCPWSYVWCDDTPIIYLPQYLMACLLAGIGYPICQVFSYVIFSKVLGPTPQGLWMGWLTASGSLARTVGPIFMSNFYHYLGPRVTYGCVDGFIFLSLIFLLFVYHRIVPFTEKYNAELSPSCFKKLSNKFKSTSNS